MMPNLAHSGTVLMLAGATMEATEAAGEFAISPEFPTGNGKVDLVLRTRDGHRGLIEVKSFIDMYELGLAHAQTAGYARKLGLSSATLAVFVPTPEEAVPPQISGMVAIDGVEVVVVAIGWV